MFNLPTILLTLLTLMPHLLSATPAITHLTCESNLPTDSPRPRFSWQMQSPARNARQTAYQLRLRTPTSHNREEKFTWDTGKVSSNQSLFVEYAGPPLQSSHTYEWSVRLWDQSDTPSEFSAPATLTTALLSPKDWQAQWLGFYPGHATPEPLPLAQKTFTLKKPIAQALIHITGLGHYKLYANNQPIGDNLLSPPWSRYEKTLYYDTLDLTDQLKVGDNTLTVLLAKGYYNTVGDRRIHPGTFDRPLALLAQLHVTYTDGTTELIITDQSWSWAPGPYTHYSILGGVDYDARQSPPTPADFRPVRLLPKLEGQLTASNSPPLKAFQAFSPKSVDQPEPGHYVYTFPQNCSATLRLTVKGRPGQTFRLTYAEQRHGADVHKNNGKGTIDQSGIRTPNYYQYTCRSGDPEEWYPDLYYSGFQYVELTGAVPEGFPNPDQQPVVTELTQIHVHAAASPVGAFTCSNPMVEKIATMIDRAVRSNLSHVLTDCPHREKLGWLEVPHLMWPSLISRYDLSTFGPKICRDIRDTQAENGEIPTVAPTFDPQGKFLFKDAFQYSPEWGAAGVLVPWYVYQTYGDTRCLAENYACMKGFVDYVKSTCIDGLVPKPGLGDWYDYGHGKPPGESQFTPKELTAMAIFHDCARRVADAAQVLGHRDDERQYRDLAKQIATDFNTRFYDAKTGQYKNNGSCQTANAMALVCGIVDPADLRRITDAIVNDLERRGYQQTSGDVGFHYLVRALADNGRSDALFKLLNRHDLGSYTYLVNNGWTSLPEAWDADHMSSMDHCMLGHIQEWFAGDLGGIANMGNADGVAYKRFLVRPVFDSSVTSAGYEFASPYGPIRSAWKHDGNTFGLDLTVPPNAQAELHLPCGDPDSVREGTRPATDSDGVRFVGLRDGRAVLYVNAGIYHFSSDLSGKPASLPDIVPAPVRCTVGGPSFKLTAKIRFVLDPGLDPANICSDLALRLRLPVESGTDAHDAIVFTTTGADPALGDEGYELVVSADHVIIRAPREAGLFYGCQTLRQLLGPDFETDATASRQGWTVPGVRVWDRPRFSHRGFMLDSGRHIQSERYILRTLDLMAYHKLNRFHWHLTDDQGWRVEIKGHPKLTEVGAWRTEDGKRYGGYFTREQVRRIVAHAERLHITVIPEIEMPAHSAAAVAAYPELACFPGNYAVQLPCHGSHDVFCPGKPNTLTFVEGVLSEVCDLFPSPVIHIGGDECPKDRWHRCPDCQAVMKREHLKDETALQGWFAARVTEFLKGKGRRVMGWNEILRSGWVPSGVIVQQWNDERAAVDAVGGGNDVVVSQGSWTYIDHGWDAASRQSLYDALARRHIDPRGWGYTDITLGKVYESDPVPSELSAMEAKHILGAEAEMWTELRPDEASIDRYVWPRLVALAEVCWSPPQRRDWADFCRRLKASHLRKLAARGLPAGGAGDRVDIVYEELARRSGIR